MAVTEAAIAYAEKLAAERNEKLKAYRRKISKKWYDGNKKLHLGRCKRWEHNNRDRVRSNSRAAYAANPERERARSKKWKQDNKEWVSNYKIGYEQKNKEKVKKGARVYRYKKKYDLTPEARDAMLAAQGFKCAMCPRTEPGGMYNEWKTDHRHGSKFVRGILCNWCNLGLGNFSDDPERMRAGAEYIENARIREAESYQSPHARTNPQNGCNFQCDAAPHQAAQRTQPG